MIIIIKCQLEISKIGIKILLCYMFKVAVTTVMGHALFAIVLM